MSGGIDAAAVGDEVWAALRDARQIAPLSDRYPGFDMASAYRIAAHVRTRRGEPAAGRKIGFTNRTIWERYGVDGPMWGEVTTGTLAPLDDAPVPLAGLCQPRLEPEVALRLARVPTPDMDEAALLGCVEWFAPAFEIVHSIFPDWRFTLADCVAVNALHGRLLLGPPVAAGAWAADLPALTLTLARDGDIVEIGRGENVLGGPLSALHHLVATLADEPESALRAGEIVSTGTLTDAWPIAPDTQWLARYDGTPLSTISARFVSGN